MKQEWNYIADCWGDCGKRIVRVKMWRNLILNQR